jgi:hypothetical protein
VIEGDTLNAFADANIRLLVVSFDEARKERLIGTLGAASAITRPCLVAADLTLDKSFCKPRASD